MLFSSKWLSPSLLRRQRTTRKSEIYCEMTVAVATPSTLMPHTITKKRFRQALTMPEIVRNSIGRLVSPNARRSAAPKLYMMVPGMPRK